MVDRLVGSDPACPSSEAAIGTKPVPRAVDAPKGLHGQVLGNTWVAHDAYDPGVDIALKLAYQRLERIDLAMREPLEQIHELLYLYYGRRTRRLQVFSRRVVSETSIVLSWAVLKRVCAVRPIWRCIHFGLSNNSTPDSRQHNCQRFFCH